VKLEYLNDISNGGEFKDVISENLIRLFDFNCAEILTLQKSIQRTIIQLQQSLNLSDIDYINSINCELMLTVSDKNEGIILLGNRRFECRMNLKSYRNMVSIMQPFTEKEQDGFNWLDEHIENENQIDFLLSTSGAW